MTSLSAHPRSYSVRLTGFDFEVQCPRCETTQAVYDGTNLGSGEELDLLAWEGAYRLSYSLLCWNCGGWMRGSFAIRSRRLEPPASEPGDGAG